MNTKITELGNGKVEISSFAVLDCFTKYSSKLDEYSNMDATDTTEDVIESFDNESDARALFENTNLPEESNNIREAILDGDGNQNYKRLVKYSYIADADEFEDEGIVEQYLFDNPSSL